jgi:hypothetical protein
MEQNYFKFNIIKTKGIKKKYGIELPSYILNRKYEIYPRYFQLFLYDKYVLCIYKHQGLTPSLISFIVEKKNFFDYLENRTYYHDLWIDGIELNGEKHIYPEGDDLEDDNWDPVPYKYIDFEYDYIYFRCCSWGSIHDLFDCENEIRLSTVKKEMIKELKDFYFKNTRFYKKLYGNKGHLDLGGKNEYCEYGPTILEISCQSTPLDFEYKKIRRSYTEAKSLYVHEVKDYTQILPKERTHITIYNSVSNRIYRALRGIKPCDTIKNLIGCNSKKLSNYLSNLFLKGMSIKNHGEWHIDHIIPCASFDLTDPEQQKQCFYYTNLQPLWADDNLKKGDKNV